MRTPILLLFVLGSLLSGGLTGQVIDVAPPPPPTPTSPSPEELGIFKVVEEMPRFPGCEEVRDRQERKECSQEKLLDYVYSNLSYPEIAKANGLEGTAVITFTVEKNGELSDIRIIRDPGAGLGKAASETIRQMNTDGIRWIPGLQRGRAVRVNFTMPVRFNLSEEETKTEIPADEIVFEDMPIEEEMPPPAEVKMAPPPPPPPPSPIGVPDIFKVVEEMPRYQKDECEAITNQQERKNCARQAMLDLIYANLQYPAIAKENGLEGTCVVSFIVEKDGSVADLRLMRDIGGGCGQEALRLAGLMSAPGSWVTGKQRGRPVRVQYNLPIKFKIE